jgi:peptide/nickel transport system permease protein
MNTSDKPFAERDLVDLPREPGIVDAEAEPLTPVGIEEGGPSRVGILEILRRVLHTRAGRIGFVVVALYVLAAVIGPYVAPYSATELNLIDALKRPSAHHLFGTDQFGRDIFSRVLNGARGVLLMGVASTAVGLIGGIAIGLAAGYYGGKFDEILMRIVDAFMSFPSLLLALLIVTTLGSSFPSLMLAIAVVFVPRVARVIRAATLDVRTQEFVESARLRGESGFYILFREILPNVSAPVTVEASIRLSYAILLTTSLSFLGLGAQPPNPDWGLMVAEARDFIEQAPWMVIFPALAISLLVVGANLLGDGIREVLNYSGEEARV